MFPSCFDAFLARSRAASVFLLAFACVLAGCGGGSSSSSSGGSKSTISTITVSPASPSIAVGATQQFTATAKDSSGNTISGVTFTWNSSSTSVATINSSGLATGVAQGTTQITASASGVTSSPDTLTVTAPVVASITVSPSSPSIAVGATQQFTATAKDSGGNTISGVTFTWNSANTSVATIDNSGLATALLAGSTQITASAGNITSAPDTLTVTPASSISSILVGLPGPVIFAGGNQETVTLTITNDQPNDVFTITALSNGTSCTPAVCGTFGTITGTAGSGNYTFPYTPPASLAADTAITLTVSSNLPNSFPGTVNFIVHPAGETVVTVALTNATVYNDGPGNPGAQVSLLGAGYACPASGGGTVCGTLTPGAITTGTTTSGTTGIPFTRLAFTFTPPASLPNPPYDRPMILAVSNFNNAAIGIFNLFLGLPPQGNLRINNGAKLDVALTGGAPISIPASISGDTGNAKSINWTLTAGGNNCSPQCGTLGVPIYTWNGNNVFSTITYTPPASLPSNPNDQPTLTATSVDNSTVSDSFTFAINDGTCGTGNESILNGQYAFLLKGAAASNGYISFIGSFSADGHGNITGGAFDRNGTSGAVTGGSFVSNGSSYSVGSDGRGCLTLANSFGGTSTYRIALGTLSAGVATQGRIIRFDDFTGSGARLSGVLMKQDPSAFSPSQLNGTYAFGMTGIDAAGGRVAGAGLLTSDGSGHIPDLSLDVDDNGNPTGNITGSTGSYSLTSNAPNGRGTISVTASAQNGGGTQNFIVYMVSSAEALFLASDPLTVNTPTLSGELKLQTGAPFSANALDNAGYVFYQTGVDPAGGNKVVVGQLAVSSNGATVATADTNDNGTFNETTSAATISIASNGRAIMTPNGGNATIIYLVNSSSGYLVGTGAADGFGFVQKQTATSFSNASFSGKYFFGSEAPTTGSFYQSGTAVLDGNGSATVAADTAQSPTNGLQSFSGAVIPYSFLANATPPGKGTVSDNTVAFAVSNSLIIIVQTDQPELTIVQQ
ncbi:MAG TPA: Ig-like domain-containing protein [Candidatus Acidoferrum sp.]|nr:Ig-like domain-containing protein [Candidatus Acidoferrum sp.]